MTINDAIDHAKDVADKKYKEGFLCYANSGVVENDKKNDECVECAKEHEQLAEWLEELQKYRAIGTAEECREAVERRRARKPKIELDETKSFHRYYCPVCNRYFCNDSSSFFMASIFKENYCQEKDCGQAIDWSDIL